MIATQVIVTGRVQGVWYRATTMKMAKKFGVRGWVRNLPDGAVEAHLEGEPEQVDELIDWMNEGPPLASVDDVETFPAEVQNFPDFTMR
ncbi:MAG TPA: acylphosphatase [bacterium]|nr:acylphosphatase [bacterium]